MAAMEICGSNHRKKGTRKREVCSAESASVEPTKIKPSQIKTGNQYLRKDFIQRSEVRDQTTVSFALANLQSTICHLQWHLPSPSSQFSWNECGADAVS